MIRQYALWLCKNHCCDNTAPSLLPSCAEVSEAPKFEYSISQISEHPENAPAESESTLLSSREVWEHLEVLRSTGEVARSVWEEWVLLPDRFTLC